MARLDERWPRPSDLAAASTAEVLRAWGKLGYPRRALRLQAAAAVIAAEHGDVVPDDVPTLLALPGIGTYTARAVAAFAYGRRCPWSTPTSAGWSPGPSTGGPRRPTPPPATCLTPRPCSRPTRTPPPARPRR